MANHPAWKHRALLLLLFACANPIAPGQDNPCACPPPVPPPTWIEGEILTPSNQPAVALAVYALLAGEDTSCVSPTPRSQMTRGRTAVDLDGRYAVATTAVHSCLNIFGLRDGETVPLSEAPIRVGRMNDTVRLDGRVPAGGGTWQTVDGAPRTFP
jgi:hypothetical protein